MSANEFLGALVVGLGTLLGLIISINALITKPIQAATISIVELTAAMEQSQKDTKDMRSILKDHDDLLYEHDLILVRNKLK